VVKIQETAQTHLFCDGALVIEKVCIGKRDEIFQALMVALVMEKRGQFFHLDICIKVQAKGSGMAYWCAREAGVNAGESPGETKGQATFSCKIPINSAAPLSHGPC
jgi:hypothetical protein